MAIFGEYAGFLIYQGEKIKGISKKKDIGDEFLRNEVQMKMGENIDKVNQFDGLL
jgi:hypothetical protein